MLRRYQLTVEEQETIKSMAGRVPTSVIAAVIGRRKSTVITYCVNNNLPVKLITDDEGCGGVIVTRHRHPDGETFTVNVPKALEGYLKVVLV